MDKGGDDTNGQISGTMVEPNSSYAPFKRERRKRGSEEDVRNQPYTRNSTNNRSAIGFRRVWQVRSLILENCLSWPPAASTSSRLQARGGKRGKTKERPQWVLVSQAVVSAHTHIVYRDRHVRAVRTALRSVLNCARKKTVTVNCQLSDALSVYAAPTPVPCQAL